MYLVRKTCPQRPQNVRKMSALITTAQAATLLNTTDRTIRRRLSDMSAKCPHLVRYVRKQGKNILIDIRLVYGNFERLAEQLPGMPEPTEPKTEQLPPPPEATTTTATDTKDSTAELIQLLKEQLQEKDKQINHLQQLNSELTERNREQNIIIANMQQERQNLSIATTGQEPTKRTFLQWLFRVKS